MRCTAGDSPLRGSSLAAAWGMPAGGFKGAAAAGDGGGRVVLRCALWRLLGFGDGLLPGRHRPGLGLGVDGGHHLAHLDRRALGYQDLELAGRLGVDGHGDLVRLEHQQRFLDFDPVTVGLGPLGEDALGDGLADLGDFHFEGHRVHPVTAAPRRRNGSAPVVAEARGTASDSGIISNPGHAWGSGAHLGPPSASATTAACCLRCTRREPVAGLALGSRPA